MNNNKKISRHNLIILIVSIIVLIAIGISITMARYKSTGNTDILADIAFWVFEEGFQTGNIMLKDLYPRDQAFEYTFSVSNADGTKVAETSLEYTIYLTATTNLPLEFEVYKDNEKLTGDNIENNIVLDESGQCYVRKIKINNGEFSFNQAKTDNYKLLVTFPIEYKDTEEFEGMIDNIDITVDAKQKIDFESIKTSKKAQIIWEDDNNSTGVRPSIVELTLLRDGVETATKLTANESSNWIVEFTELQKYNEDGEEIPYIVKISPITYYHEPIYSADTLTITNALNITSIKTQKIINVVWDDDNNQAEVRPSELEFVLIKDGIETGTTVTITSHGSWRGSFSNLQKYTSEGREIQYTVRQINQVPNYKLSTYSTDTLTVTNEIDYTTIMTEKTASVIWRDDNNQLGIRPTSVELTLIKDGTVTSTKLTANEESGWLATFTNLQKYTEEGREIVYTVSQSKVSGYQDPIYGGSGLTVTNNPDYTIMTTEKIASIVWDDNNNQSGKRPAEVELTLVKDGTVTSTKLTANEANGWIVIFTSLPKYTETGREIVYKVVQSKLENYQEPTYSRDGLTVTNTIE